MNKCQGFNLSEKLVQGQINLGEVGKYIMEEDVRKFVRLLKEELDENLPLNKLEIKDAIIDKLAGEKLCQ